MSYSLPRAIGAQTTTRSIAALWLGALLALSAPAAAAPPEPSSSALVPIGELPPLPTLEPIRKIEADPEALKELDGLLARLVSDKADIREHARASIDDVPATLVPAIHLRIQELRQSIDRDAVPRLLADVRKAGRAAKKTSKKDKAADKASDDKKTDDKPDRPKKKAKKKKGDSKSDDKKTDDKKPDPSAPKGDAKDDEEADGDDWLAFALESAKPESDTWKDLVHLLATERMLVSIGTTPAVRELIELRANFGDMLRIDLQRQIEKLKDKAVPALIEARKHDAAIVQRFAETELDKLGRAIPGEAVASDDPDVLADVLRAFGRTRDVDAVRVALSFANSDRRKVRQAAREAIAGIGEPGRWQLRDAFQDLTGEKPDKSVPWDVLARQIFAIYDKGRLAEFEKLVQDGLDAAKAGKHADAVTSFDKVLARDPLFDRRKEMAPSYLAVALALPIEEGDKKLALLRKAQRLDPGGKEDQHIEGQIAYVEARLLMKEGRPDRFLLERALELDPSNKEARDLLASFEEKAVTQKKSNVTRFAGAAGIFVGMVALALGIGLWGRKKRPRNGPPPPPRSSPPEGSAPPPEPAQG